MRVTRDPVAEPVPVFVWKEVGSSGATPQRHPMTEDQCVEVVRPSLESPSAGRSPARMARASGLSGEYRRHSISSSPKGRSAENGGELRNRSYALTWARSRTWTCTGRIPGRRSRTAASNRRQDFGEVRGSAARPGGVRVLKALQARHPGPSLADAVQRQQGSELADRPAEVGAATALVDRLHRRLGRLLSDQHCGEDAHSRPGRCWRVPARSWAVAELTALVVKAVQGRAAP